MPEAVEHRRGRYQYLCNGEDAGVEESWQLIRRADQVEISSVRDVPAVGIRLEVESLQNREGFRHCGVHWQQASADNFSVRANYHFSHQRVEIERQVQDQPPELVIDTSGFVFSPLLRIYNGGVIRQLLDQGGNGRVMVPWIKDIQQRNRLLTPAFSERQVALLGEDELTIDGVATPCQKFEYCGGEYQPGTFFWLDEHDVMLRYSWRQGGDTRWEVSLRDYSSGEA